MDIPGPPPLEEDISMGLPPPPVEEEKVEEKAAEVTSGYMEFQSSAPGKKFGRAKYKNAFWVLNPSEGKLFRIDNDSQTTTLAIELAEIKRVEKVSAKVFKIVMKDNSVNKFKCPSQPNAIYWRDNLTKAVESVLDNQEFTWENPSFSNSGKEFNASSRSTKMEKYNANEINAYMSPKLMNTLGRMKKRAGKKKNTMSSSKKSGVSSQFEADLPPRVPSKTLKRVVSNEEFDSFAVAASLVPLQPVRTNLPPPPPPEDSGDEDGI